MKALIVERPGKLAVREIPEPPMGEYEVRCRMLYGATCTGTALHVIDGTFAEHVDYPSVIGHESIGEVIEAGAKVRNFKLGDLITRVGTRAQADGSVKLSWGGMCEYGLAVDHRAARLDGVDLSVFSLREAFQLLNVELKSGFQTLDITRIGTQEARILDTEDNRNVFLVRYTSTNSRDQVVEYGKCYIRGDKFSFKVDYDAP